MFGLLVATLNDKYTLPGEIGMIRDGVRQKTFLMRRRGRYPLEAGTALTAELFVAPMSTEGFKKLVNSKSVELRLDQTEFALTPENLAALRDFASRMQ